MKNFVNKFNNLIQKTIFKVRNKTNKNLKITNFSKYLITFISLLFLYVFYLLIPTLYDKTWVQNKIENKLLEEFKINFSISSDISYRILPKPHFLIKNSKIIKEDEGNNTVLSNIKNLKIFISKKKLFNKEQITLKYIIIDNANFLLTGNDLRLLKSDSTKKFSNKKIEINKSNIFIKNNSDETIVIIKISKAFLFLDNKDLFNLFKLKGEVFNVPFSLDYKKEFGLLKNEIVSIIAKSLKLNILSTHDNKKNNLSSGSNIISFLKSKFNTDYTIEDGIITFKSSNPKIVKNKVNYNGEILINPFTVDLKVDLGKIKMSKMLDLSPVLLELIKSRLLFNENITVNTEIMMDSSTNREIFQSARVNLNFVNGSINFDKTKLFNKKIGSLELESGKLFIKNDKLTFNTNVIIDIKNPEQLFSLLQVNKKTTKEIKKFLINLDYDFLDKQLKFNTFEIDNNKASDELLRILQGFDEKNFNNWNDNRRLLKILIENYEG